MPARRLIVRTSLSTLEPAHLVPASALDSETQARAEAVCCPDRSVGLHRAITSEGFASPLSGQRTRPTPRSSPRGSPS